MSVTAPVPPKHAYYLKALSDIPVWYTLFDGIMDPVKTLIDSHRHTCRCSDVTLEWSESAKALIGTAECSGVLCLLCC